MVKNGIFIGLTTIDIQYLIDTFPGANVKVKTDAPDVMVGGPATNAAVIFAHLNGNAELYSAIGINPFRNYILDDLTKHKNKGKRCGRWAAGFAGNCNCCYL